LSIWSLLVVAVVVPMAAAAVLAGSVLVLGYRLQRGLFTQ
jgi:hypothetical protein